MTTTLAEPETLVVYEVTGLTQQDEEQKEDLEDDTPVIRHKVCNACTRRLCDYKNEANSPPARRRSVPCEGCQTADVMIHRRRCMGW